MPSLEDMARVAHDAKKAFGFRKDTAQWYWYDRDVDMVAINMQGPFDTYLDALRDATEPYFVEDE